MMDREREQRSRLMSEGKQVNWSQWPLQGQECSMCGDVGFADQLHQCSLCRFRYQHTYCYTSKEGLRTGTWICDWCRLLKKETRTNGNDAQAPAGVSSSILLERSGGLECLLEVTLNEARHAAEIQSLSGDGGSLCSSSIESVQENESSPRVLEARSCYSEERVSHGEESRSAFKGGSPRVSTCDSKKNPKPVRSGMKTSQKKRQKSLLEQQCGSVQLKRLSSLKSSKTGIACDPPKSFVRRYKSLSDISF